MKYLTSPSNHDARQTLFAINHWHEGAHAGLDPGNQSSANPDWTFAGNAASYPFKRLRILVRCPLSAARPVSRMTLLAISSPSLRQLSRKNRRLHDPPPTRLGHRAPFGPTDFVLWSLVIEL